MSRLNSFCDALDNAIDVAKGLSPKSIAIAVHHYFPQVKEYDENGSRIENYGRDNGGTGTGTPAPRKPADYSFWLGADGLPDPGDCIPERDLDWEFYSGDQWFCEFVQRCAERNDVLDDLQWVRVDPRPAQEARSSSEGRWSTVWGRIATKSEAADRAADRVFRFPDTDCTNYSVGDRVFWFGNPYRIVRFIDGDFCECVPC